MLRNCNQILFDNKEFVLRNGGDKVFYVDSVNKYIVGV